MKLYLAPILFLTAVPFAAALAQQSPAPAAPAKERINQMVVYGDDPCPRSDGDEIVVCARKAENERFRIPEALRGNANDPRRDSWSNKAQRLEYVGRSGIGSCSPNGSGGASGCFAQLMHQAREEMMAGDGTDWAALVEAARQERLSNIDAESAAIQAELEAREKAKPK